MIGEDHCAKNGLVNWYTTPNVIYLLGLIFRLVAALMLIAWIKGTSKIIECSKK